MQRGNAGFLLRLATCLLLSGSGLVTGADEEPLPYSLTSAGKSCENVEIGFLQDVESVQACADAACAEPLCGAAFLVTEKGEGGALACRCLGLGQACGEVAEPNVSVYEISDVSACASKDAGEAENCFATLYETAFFSGWSVSFVEGKYSSDVFASMGAVDKEASSLLVSGEGCEATVFGGADFTGWSVTFAAGDYSGDAFLEAGAKDDDVSSIIVRRRGAAAGGQSPPPAPPAPPPAPPRPPLPPAPPPPPGAPIPGTGEPVTATGGRAAADDGSRREDIARAPGGGGASPPPRTAASVTPPPKARPRAPAPPPPPAVDWDAPKCEPITRAGCSPKEVAFIEDSHLRFQDDRLHFTQEAKRLKGKYAFLKPEQREWIVQRVAILNRLAAKAVRLDEL